MSDEKIYTIPIRKLIKNPPRWKSANKSIKAIKKFLKRHLKSDFVIHNSLNEKVWEKGNRYIFAKLKIRAVKQGEKWTIYPAEFTINVEKKPTKKVEQPQKIKKEKEKVEKIEEDKKKTKTKPKKKEVKKQPEKKEAKKEAKKEVKKKKKEDKK